MSNPIMERLFSKLEKNGSWMNKVSAAITPEVEKEALSLPGIAKIKELAQRGGAALGKAGKVMKWGGLGLGAYLLLKSLEGVNEAKQEATLRGY